MPDEIILVKSLHDNDDAALGLVVESAQQGVVIPFIDCLPPRFGQRLIGFEGIVDDDQIGAATGQPPADRGRHAGSLPCCCKIVHRLPLRQPGREQRAIPAGRHDAPTVARELIGEVLAVARADDVRRRIMTKQPGGKGDRSTMRLEASRRQVDDETPDLPLAARFELGRDHLEMRGQHQRGLRVQFVERAHDKAHQILTQDDPIFGGRDGHFDACGDCGISSGSASSFGWVDGTGPGDSRSDWRNRLRMLSMTFWSSAVSNISSGVPSAKWPSWMRVSLSKRGIARRSPVAALLTRSLAMTWRLAIFLRLPFSVMVTDAFSSSSSAVAKFLAPFGRPLELPDCPGLNFVDRGGLPKPTS